MSRHNFRVASVILAFALALAVAASGSAHAQRRGGGPPQPDFDAFYELGPDSLVRRGVPKGRVEGPFTLATAVSRRNRSASS